MRREDLGDLANGHAVIADGVQDGASRCRLERQAEQARGAVPMHGGPAV